MLASQEKMVFLVPQVLRDLPVTARWAQQGQWVSKAFQASPAPQVLWASQGRLATATPQTALEPCQWSNSTPP